MRKLYLLVLGLLITVVLKAQVTVTSPSLSLSGCSFPTSYAQIADITIAETNTSDLTGTGDFILTAPANFEFQPGAGSITSSGADIIVSGLTITPNTITFTIEVDAAASLDEIVISGINIRAVNLPSGPADILRASGIQDAVISGDDIADAKSHGILTSAFSPIPAPSFTSAAGTTECAGTGITYTTEAGESDYAWSLPGVPGVDYVIVSGGTGSASNTVTLQWLTTGNKQVTVNYSNNSGCMGSDPAVSNTNVTPGIPPVPGTITGATAQCPGTALQTYSIAAVADATNYIWTVPPGWSINAAAGTNSITVTAGSTGQNGDITVSAGNSCGLSAASNLAVTVEPGIPSVPGTITGPTAQCPQAALQTYSTPAVANATGYTWTVPSGWSITAGAGTNSITVTAGSAGQNGDITVSAGNSCGASTASTLAVTVDPGPPATPGPVSGTTAQCPATTLQTYSITAVTDATGYTWTVPPGWSITAGAGTNSITVTAGSAGQNGNITVTADNSCGSSATINLAVTVGFGTPSAPVTNAGTAAACDQITANWAASANASIYYIDVSTVNTFASFVPGYNNLAVGNITTLNITGLAAGTTYYYRVRAGNSCGTSNSSAAITYATLPATPAVPPVNAGSAASCTQITANWTASANATAYFIDVSTVNTFASFVGAYNNLNAGNVTTLAITGLTAGTTYYYRVRAANNCGTSSSSPVITYATLPAAPLTPAAGAGSGAGCNQINTNWAAAANATTYFLDVSTVNTFASFVSAYNNLNVGNVTSFPVTGLAPGTTYYYRVRAGNSCGTSGSSLVISYATLPGTPATPAASAGSGASCNQITANWSASVNAAAYYIDVSTVNTFASFLTGYNNLNAGNVTTLTITGLASGTTYYYRVRANNTCGTSGNSTVITYATLPATPAAPTANAGSGATCNQITAKWTASANATAYFIDVSNINTFASFVSGYNNLNVGNVTTLNITGLSSGTTYYYRIRAANSCGTSASSAIITYATLPSTPATPGSITGNATKCPGLTGQVYSISAVANATTYTWTVPSGWNITAGQGTTSITVTTGTAGQNGNISVTAGNSCGTSAISNLAVTVSPGTPANPGTITGTGTVCPGISGLTYTIAAVANATTYTWTVPAGWSITSGQGTVSITATSGGAGQNGNIAVTAGNSCGTSSPSQTININPAVGTNNTGYATSGAKSDGNITVASSTATPSNRRGYLKFPLAAVPAGATITSAVLSITNNASETGSTATNLVTDLGSNDPATATAGTLYNAIASGAAYNSSSWNSSGTIALSLNAAAIADIQSNLSSPGYIGMGLYRSTGSATYNFFGYSGGANAPELSITYSVPGGSLPVTVSPGTPAVPGTNSATGTACTQFTARWLASANATAYFLDVSTSNTFASFVTGFNNQNAGNVLSINVTGLTAGTTYYYRVRANNSCGTSGSSATITTATSPATPGIPGSITGNISLCPGVTNQAYSVVAVPNATTYTWTVPAGWTITGGQGTRAITATAGTAGQNGNITVTAGNTCGTSAASTLAVVVNARPVAGAITGSNTVCINGTVSLVANATGAAPFTYTWASSNTAVATITTAGIVTGKATGTTQITYTVTDANGCSQTSANFAVTITKPTANAITGTASVVCINSSISLTANAAGVATLSYTWASSNTAVATVTNSGVVTGIAAGSANITYTVTDGNGCSTTSAAYPVTVNAIPTGSLTITETSGAINNDGVICEGAPVTFTATGGFGSYIFKLNGTTVLQSGTSNIYSSSSLANGASITVDVANSLNCGATFGPVILTVNSLPAPILTADKTAICPGDPVVFTATGGTQYTFKVNGSPVQSGTSGTYSTSTLTSGSAVTVDVANANGCMKAAAPVMITVNPLPSGTLSTAGASICAGDNITFVATAGLANYNFQVNGSSVQNGAANTYSSPTMTNAEVVTVTVTNSSGCVATFNSIVVTVNALPAGTFTISENSGAQDDNLICFGAPVTFAFDAGYANYNFKVNGASKQNGTSNSYVSTTLTSGDIVTVEVSNSSNCKVVFTAPSIAVSSSPTGNLTVSPASICALDDVTFTATSGYDNYNFQLNGITVQNGPSNTFNSTSLANGDVVAVDVSNSNGCTTTFNAITLAINPLPTGTLVPVENSGITVNDGIICSGATVTFTAPAGFSNYDFILNGATVQGGASTTYVNSTLLNGDKVEVAIANANGCIALLNPITITAHALPVVSPVTGILDVCVNNTSVLENATAGGIWSSMNTNIATVAADGTVTGVTAGTAVITYSVTNANGCEMVVSATVTVHALPAVSPITGTPDVCVNSSTPLANTTAGGVWSSLNTAIATVDAGGIVTGVSGGTATINYTVTNASGCITTAAVQVTVHALPVVAVITTGGPFDVCVGSTIALADATAGGSWTSSDPAIATINASGIITGVADGTSTISYSIASNGCITTVTQIVTVHGLPVPTLDGPNPICPNSTGVYTTEAGQSNYVWTVTGGIISGPADGNSVTVDWGGAGPKSIFVNYKNAFGCSGAASATVTTSTGTVPALTGPSAVCQLSDGTFTTQAGFSDYEWTVTGGSISAGGTSTDNTATINFTVPGNGSVSVNFTDGNGCSGTAPTIHPVAVKPLPTATVSGSATVCQGSASPAVTFTGAGSTAPYTFTYTINGGANLTVVSTGNVATVPAPTGTSGLFIYNLVGVQDAGSTNCSQAQTGSATISVTAMPSATITYNSGPFCTSGGPVPVTRAGTPGGTYSSAAGLTIDAATGTINPSTSTGGTYTVTYTIAAAGGCGIYTTTTQVTVTTAPSAIIAYGGAQFCTSSAPVNVTITGTPGGSYSSSAGLTINATTGTITPATSSAGTYTVTYTIAASAGCAQFTTTAQVTITAAPSATISYSGGPFCTSSGARNVTLTGTAGGSYTSSPGLSINAATGTITPSTSSNGTYTVTYTVPASGGCSQFTTTATVSISATPTAVAGPSLSTCAGSGAVNITMGSGATNQSNVLWTSAGSGVFTNANSLTAATYTPSAAEVTAGIATLTLTVSGNGTCAAATSSKTLTINAAPAAFVLTPATASICTGDVQPLSASANTSTTGSKITSSGTINLSIPDASAFGDAGSVASTIVVSGVPAGAVINSVTVNFNITHSYHGDLILNLKAPNGNVLNLVNKKGSSGDNFTNTIISSSSVSPVNTGNASFTGTYAPDAVNNVGTPASNVNAFSSLYATPNGNWVFGVEDHDFHFGTGNNGVIGSWSLTINYTIPNLPLAVTWSPLTNLYTDPGATTAYTGQSLATVYVKSTASGNTTYTATATNASNCSTSKTVAVTVNPKPVVTISADYCVVPGKVRLTANSIPAASSYLWSTGATTQFIDVDIAGTFDVTAFGAGSCPGKATIAVATELVVNGDFESGNVGFTSPPLGANQYQYIADGAANNELLPEGLYGVGPDAHTYHTNFWGHDHTTGDGNFMIINGFPNGNPQPIIWQETVSVLPNTTYYFSAWGMSVNASAPFAQLQFNVNGTQVGTNPTLAAGVTNNSNNGWTRFYGTWTSGPTVTNAVISITDLQNALGGNDFGLDDISFGTLSTFITLESAAGTDAQTVCANAPITDIVYSTGSTASGPTITGLPPGLTTSFNGVLFTISGTPTAAGTYTYTITSTGSCNPSSATGIIMVQSQSIALSSGSSSPAACVNTPVSITYTLGGTATGATVAGLPAGVAAAISGNTLTISGTPTNGGTYPYTITTSGTCDPVTAAGTITVQSQTITLNSASASQTTCINSPITNIQYNIGGAGTGATVSGLPPGVSGSYSAGLFIISGTPTSAAGSPYNYTVTTTGGSCQAVTATGSITVTPGASLALTSGAGTNPQTVCKSTPVINITYAVTNATGATVSGLPTGVTGSFSSGVFTISGTPAANGGTFNYTVTTTGGCAIATATGAITIQAQSIALTSGSASPSLCGNTAMPNIVYTIGGTATGATVSGLPAGITGSLSGNLFTVSGTPTAPAGSYTYVVTTSGACAAATANGTITVQSAATGGSLTSIAVCVGSGGSLTLSGQAGTIQRWELSTNGGGTWTPITNTSISQAYTNISAPAMYRVVVNNGCGQAFSSVAAISIRNYWTGAISADWNTAGNWSDGQVPTTTPCPTVTIPAVTAPNASPVLSSGAAATIANLVIQPGASLTIAGNLMKIAGTLTNSGMFDVSNGALEFNGSAPQTIPANAFANNKIKDLIISNNVSLAGVDSLTGTLSFGGSGKTFATDGNLTLKSTASGTASVAKIINGNNITGDVTVERYISTKRAWRFLAIPTNTTQTIKDAWQEGAVASGINPVPHYGTQVTHHVAPTTANGFDYDSPDGPSVKKYDITATGIYAPYRSINSAFDPIATKEGLMTFVRGDRTAIGLGATPTPTVLRTKGPLYTGNQAPIVIPANQFVSIGNPYACPLDMRSISKTAGVNNNFYVWDARLTGNLGFGAYQTFTLIGSDYVPTPGDGSYPVQGPSPIVVPYNYIESGLAFFVDAKGNTGGTLTFNENAKAAGALATPVALRPVSPMLPDALLRTNLYAVEADSSTSLVDGVLSDFGEYSNEVDQMDVIKISNFAENLALKTDSQLLVVERRHTVMEGDTLHLHMLKMKVKSYRFVIAGENFNQPGLIATLEDSYLNTHTLINVNGVTTYDFNINYEPGAWNPSRFMIVFRQATVLPVTLTSIKAHQVNKDVSVEWKVENEGSIKKYEVEKSVDGLHFSRVTTITDVHNNGGTANYQWLDKKPVQGSNYYRIRSTGMNGEVKYSTIVKVITGGGRPQLAVYPNPVTDGKINLHLINQPAGRYAIRLMNRIGQLLLVRQIEHDEGTVVEELKIKLLAHGNYHLEVTGPDKKITNINIHY